MLLGISFTPHIIFANAINKDYKSTYVEIHVDNNLFKTIDLANDTNETIDIKSKLGTNSVLIKNNQIQINHANCKDSLCMKQKAISKIGQSIICLPNKVIVEIKGDMNSSSNEDIILSH
ncbi:MAG: NusG domain II-containing protein [Sarcina sp.]